MAEKLDIEKIKKETANPKYEADYATPCGDAALFLPSISSLYARHVSKDDADVRGGDCPKGMSSIQDLDFLDPEKGIYWYPWALYSAGHAQLDLTKTDIQESMVQLRDRDRTFILADSGGYQLSTGVLKGNMGDLDSMEVDETSLRHKIMKWIEHTADFGMILDIPTTSCMNPKSFINKKYSHLGDTGMFYKCLEYTVKNNAYFIKHRVPGKTKLLNVLQGRDINSQGTGENDIWYNVVKFFNMKEACLSDVRTAYNSYVEEYNRRQKDDNLKIGLMLEQENETTPFGERAFEGWAIPGNLKFDFEMLVQRFKIMYEEGFLDDTGENLLIHFLGISRVSAGLLYTTLQNQLREHINPNVIITYDAASPFVCTAKGKGYGIYTVSNEKMTYRMDTLPDQKAEPRYKKKKEVEGRADHFNELFSGGKDEWMKIPLEYSKSNSPWHDHHITGKDIVEYTETAVGEIREVNRYKIDTTLGKRLTVGDICYKTPDDIYNNKPVSSWWDGTSYVYIMNMNVEQHIRAIQEAHVHWNKPDAYKYLPPKIVNNGSKTIELIVSSKFDTDVVNSNLSKLENILGMKAQRPGNDLTKISEEDHDGDYNFEDAIEEGTENDQS